MMVAAFMAADNNTWGSLTSGWTTPKGRTQWRNSNTTGTSLSVAYQILTTAGVNGAVSNTEALANPGALKLFEGLEALRG